MLDPPSERLAYKKPAFTNTGLDCFGPLHVTVRQTTEKRWILIITCLTTRAIHLEVLQSLNTSSCMIAIDRFVAHRCRPDFFWSNNGTIFVSASKKVNTIETAALQEKCSQRRIKGKFKTLSAPNQGGAWESLIKSCKKILFTVLGSSKVKEVVLSTSLCLVEQAMTSRRLFLASSDPTDPHALSPNKFLNCGEVLQPAVFAREAHSAHHRRVYQQAQHYADAIWTRWLKEDVSTLNARHKWTKTTEPLAKGELVLLVESHSPRGNYPLARVCELNYDSKGVARTAKL